MNNKTCVPARVFYRYSNLVLLQIKLLLQKRIENISCISCHKRPKKKPAPVHLAPWTNHVKSFLSSERFISLQVQSVLKKLDFCFVLLGLCLCLLKKKSLLLVLSFAPRGFSPYSGFPLSSKTNISKFQFDQESGRRRTTSWMCFLQIIIYLFVYLFIYNKCYQDVNTTPAYTMRKYVLPKVNCRDVVLALSQSELTKGLRNQGIAGWNGIGGNMATWNTRIY